ncbi:MAG TPA: class I SAM-dependent methyltransferase, partial [Nitrosopumilaceae archaeon]|nr:class I SAM-dependent methyltransferase [Nitrosopumilaceae archaeon]
KIERTQAKKITHSTILDVNLLQNVPDIGPFDAVVMFHVLEHIPNPISFLNNVKKLLRRGGKLLVEVPNLNDYQLRLNEAYKKWHWQLAHLNYFTPSTLKKVIRSGGFKDVKIQGIQRYSIENMFSWKLTGKPQLNAPTHILPIEYEWLEKYYKNHLERSLQSDAIIAVARC